MRRHWLRRSVIVVVVLVVVVFFVGNAVATGFAESQLSNRARADAGARSASATVGPFPLLAYLIGRGEVPSVSVTLRDVSFAVTASGADAVPEVPVQQAVVDLHDVSVSRSGLLGHQAVDVTRIGSARVSLTITANGLSAAAGIPVSLPGDGRVDVRVDGVTQSGSLRITDGDTLELTADGHAVASVALHKGDVLPACAMAIAFHASTVVASCTMKPVPGSLVRAMARGSNS